MIKKTQIIELFKNIKSTKVTFISILMFVSLAVAIFTGFSWTSGAIKQSVNEEYEEASMYDLDVTYPYGFTDENIEKFKELDGIDYVEGIKSTFRFYKTDSGKQQIKIFQLSKDIVTPLMISGSLPEKRGEIAVEKDYARKQGINIGDGITFEQDDDSRLATDDYVVTALIESPQYISHASDSYGVGNNMINVSGLMFVNRGSFSKDKQDYYTEVLMRSDELRGLNTYSDEYKENSDALRGRISQSIADIAGDRYAEINRMQEDAIADIEEDLASALKKINDGKSTLSNKKAQYNRAQSKLSQMKKSLSAGEKELATTEQAVTGFVGAYQGFHEICQTAIRKETTEQSAYIHDKAKDGTLRRQLNSIILFANEYIEDSNKDYIVGEITKTLEYIADESFNTEIALVALNNVDNGIAPYVTDIEKKLADKKADLAAGQSKLKKFQGQLAVAKKQITKAETDLFRARDKYDKSRTDADEYIAALPDLIKYDCNIGTREDNTGFAAMGLVIDSLDKLKYTMAILFVVVGLLVCYSAVSRTVYDQSIKIGTKKALGFLKKEITKSYLAYTAIAVLIGSVLGFTIAIHVIESLMIKVLSNTYVLALSHKYYEIGLALLVTFIELVLLLLCTWLACISILKKNAVDLLSQSQEKSANYVFFERWRLWNKMSLFSKTVVRNCITDKRRVFATLVGITGCTALIVCAVMMSNNLEKSFAKHFDKIFRFDNIVYYLNDGDSNAREEIQQTLSDNGIESTAVLGSVATINMPDGSSLFGKYFVPTDDKFNKFVKIIQMDKTDVPEDESVWLSVSYAKEYDVKPGAEFNMVDATGQARKLTIAGFFEYYLPNLMIVIPSKAYEKEWGEEPIANAVFLNSKSIGGSTGVDKLLNNIEGYVYTNDYYTSARTFFDSFTNVAKAIVVIYLVLSILMALLVLLNLFTMFVEEKRKEIIVLRINGFSIKAARSYIYRDTILLTAIGIVLGVILGFIMGAESIHSIESSMTYFIKSFDWRAGLTGVAVSAFMSFAMINIALKRIKKFGLSDINK